MIYKSWENPSKHDLTRQEHKSLFSGRLSSLPWTNPPFSKLWHVLKMILQKTSYITNDQSIMLLLLLILKLVKIAWFQKDCHLFALPPVQGIPSLPLSHITHCICMSLCVLCDNEGRLENGQWTETLLFKADTSLSTLAPASSLRRLPILIYDPTPGHISCW